MIIKQKVALLRALTGMNVRDDTTALLHIKSIKDLERTRCSYQQRMENENKLYSHLERTEAGAEKVNASLAATLDAFQERARKAVGTNVWDYVVECANSRENTKMLSLGAGTCGLEISLATRFKRSFQLHCIDANAELITRGMQIALANGVTITPVAQDINSLKLDQTYDIVFAHAILHHLVELEHVLDEVRSNLSEDGRFIVYDITARNGLLLWPEQRKIIDGLLAALPSKFTYSHLLKRNTQTFAEIDHSDQSFECIRSQDVLPLLQEYFATELLVKGFAFLRRFTENEFGSNFDLRNDFDLKLFHFLLELDQWYVDNGVLKPEAVFWVGRKH